MEDRILSLIGFSKKAGMLSSGTNRVIDTIKFKKATLVIMANDISDNTYDKISGMAKLNKIKVIKLSTIEKLSKISGEENKGVYSILDKKFSEPIIKLYETKDN